MCALFRYFLIQSLCLFSSFVSICRIDRSSFNITALPQEHNILKSLVDDVDNVLADLSSFANCDLHQLKIDGHKFEQLA